MDIIKNVFKSKAVQFILQALPFIVIIFIVIVFLLSGNKFTVERLLSYTPDNYLWAATFILMLFAVTSVSIIMPVVVLYITTGCIFPLFPALLINFAGEIIGVAIAYWVGRYAGSNFAEKLIIKYPKVKELSEKQQRNEWFISYFLRVCPIPNCAVSLYLGSMNISFRKYIIAGFLGELPAVIYSTLIGASLSEPSSLMLIISAAVTIILSGSSVIIYKYIQKTKIKKTDAGSGGASGL